MTNETRDDAQAGDPIVDVDMIADLDAPDDDVDVINGGCKTTRLVCSPSETV